MANQKSYNQLIDYLNSFANQHQQIKSFGNGFRYDINNIMTIDNEFPFLYVEPLSHTFIEFTQNYNIRVYCMDLKQKDSSNETEIISDTLQILNDLVKYIKNDVTNDWDIINQPVAIPNTNYGVEFCTGWFIDLTVQVTINDTDCDIPL
jgi:hypothetical protein